MHETKHAPEQKNAHIHTWKYRGGEKRGWAVRRYREIVRRIAGRVKNPNISPAVSICAN